VGGFSFLKEQKTLLRKELRQKRDALKPEERLRRSRAILEKLQDHPKFLESHALLSYVAFGSEVETRPLFEEAMRLKKKVYASRLEAQENRMVIVELRNLEELKPGAYGILEPPSDSHRVGRAEELDLVIVPGIGFDRKGGRLGRGEGFFDRFLQEAKNAYKIGLAFECQMVERVPREENDMSVDEVIIG